MHSHATYATPLLMDSTRARVFIVSRGVDKRGAVGWVDVATDDPRRVLGVSDRPCLLPGLLGAFDDRGISIGSIHRMGTELWLYYMGWNKSADVPFRNAIGLAIARDGVGERFERAFEGPLVDRSRFDPFTISYPFVVPGIMGGAWTMYYGTSRGGGDREEDMKHVITSASSANGIDWEPSGRDVLGLDNGEFGLSRPWMFAHAERTFMLFSIRKAQYAIGLAERMDDGGWRRLSSNVLGPSSAGWDDAATCYPAVLACGGRYLMFYSGNGYGRTGFGAAFLEFGEAAGAAARRNN